MLVRGIVCSKDYAVTSESLAKALGYRSLVMNVLLSGLQSGCSGLWVMSCMRSMRGRGRPGSVLSLAGGADA
eukprot:4568647-Pyramimonas_sp.AAC.1